MKYILIATLLLISQYSYSQDYCKNSNALYYLPFNDNDIILFDKQKFIQQGVTPPDDYRISVSWLRCDTGEKQQIDLLPYLGDPGKVNSAFLAKNNGNKELFIIYQVDSPNGENYSSDLYSVLVYEYQNNKFEANEKLSKFFDIGADIQDALIEDRLQNIYEYPYKNIDFIRKALASNLFKKWQNKESTEGQVLRKTKLQELSHYLDNEKRYLIKNDKFKAIDISAGWLKVAFNNPKKGVIEGWIMCKGTNLCDKSGVPL